MNSNVSRTKRTILNAGTGIIDNIVKLFIKFASRYVFIITLGQIYLGASALFSSIITMLSLADLGFSIALPQSLYEPLAKKDENRICVVMKFYSKVYKIIALIIVLIGIALLPFIKDIIGAKDTSGIEHLNIIYMLFIIQSAVSYLFIYKRTLFTADQKNYYVTLIETIVSLISTGLQIIVLLLFQNYIIYLIVAIVATITQNIIISMQCDKNYPFLKEIKNAESLTREESMTLTKKIYSLFIYKAAIAVESGTDNMVMTSVVGLVMTGLCSNYTLVISSVAGLLMVMMSSATASVGNVIVTESKENTYKIYQLLDFIGFWVYSVCGICILALINPFIKLWLGTNYLIDLSTTIFLCINFYICGVQNVNSNFRNAYGLFYEGRYRPICMIIINVAASIFLANRIGVTGIFIGTLLSRILTVGIFDPYIVFKHGLKKPIIKYYQAHGIYHLITIGMGCFIFLLFNLWETNSIVGLILKAVTVFGLTNLVLVMFFYKTDNFKDMSERFVNILRKIVNGK